MMTNVLDYLDNLDKLTFRAPDAEFFRSLWPTIVEIAKKPSSNPPAAAVLLLIAVTVVAMIGLSVIYFFANASDEDEYEYEEVAYDEDGHEVGRTALIAGAVAAPVVAEKKAPRAKDPLRHYTLFLAAVGVALLLLVVTGFSTQQSSVCLSCHADTPHTEQSSSDAHSAVACTRCHEGSGVFGRLTAAVPIRVAHIVSGMVNASSTVDYGVAPARACENCHGDVAKSTLVLPERALRISHKEPLEAGADCLDCHRLDGNEKMAKATAGMEPCRRCHDDVITSADCSVCHTGDVSRAVVARHSSSKKNASKLVPNPGCYGCHDTKKCDACHGVRLPHPADWTRTHMKAAARDLWNNGGRKCYSCHAAGKRSCQRAGCHIMDMPQHGPDWKTKHATENGCDAWCHNRQKNFKSTCDMCH